jgi:hypothetical protein
LRERIHEVLPMSPNTCYPCPRPIHPLGKGERKTEGRGRISEGHKKPPP